MSERTIAGMHCKEAFTTVSVTSTSLLAGVRIFHCCNYHLTRVPSIPKFILFSKAGYAANRVMISHLHRAAYFEVTYCSGTGASGGDVAHSDLPNHVLKPKP